MTTTTAGRTSTLKRREFFARLRDELRDRLPPDRRDFESRLTMNLLKVHFNANFRIHYEVMISAERGVIEVGLHFEDGPDSTTRLLEHFDRNILEIKHELGANCEIERWTKSWGHIFEMRALSPLTPALAGDLAGRLEEMIAVLQPVLDEAFEAGLVSTEPRPSHFRSRFRNRRG